MKTIVMRFVILTLMIGFVFGAMKLATALPYAQTGVVPVDAKYPDKDDQLILFRLQARIARDNQQIMQAQQMYEAADKDVKEAGPQYQHAVEAVRGKLPAPPTGKVWVSREDPANAMQFTLVDAKAAGPVPSSAQVEKKDQP